MLILISLFGSGLELLCSRVGGHFSLLSVFLATSDSGVNEKNKGTFRDVLLEAHCAVVFQ